jgi:nitroreductase
MQCFAERRSSRGFSTEKLPLQIVGEVLFAADGATRKDGRKTVPTARNKQNQRVYAFTSEAVYLYNSRKHSLELVKNGDFRKICGTQPFHAKAPLVLVFVSDMTAVGNTPELKALYAGNHSGSASQNVYLYAASKNLATVVCGMLDRKKIKDFLNLPSRDMVIFSQPIGYPAK